MDCKEIQRMIPAYLNDELEGKTAELFLQHMDTCPVCKEELCIQFLVEVGTARLEDGGSFDLNRELELNIASAKKKLKHKKTATWTIYSLEFLAIVAVMFILFLVFMR